jgi:pimeloyl-ACP methyl ester carboxylesterase
MHQPPTTYFIGGIATDAFLFRYPLQVVPRSVYLPFPLHNPADTMESYVLKFLPLINTNEPFNLVANSMGGMMAMELCRHIHPLKVVLISSVKCRAEMPPWLRSLQHTGLHRLLQGSLFIKGIEWGSGLVPEVQRIPGLRKGVVAMARHNNPAFLEWCVNAIAHWKGPDDYRADIYHIHGTADRLFPYRRIRNAIPIQGGTHKMLLTRAAEVTKVVMKCLKSS